MSNVYQKQTESVFVWAVGQLGRRCVDNTHGSIWDSSILVESPSSDNSFSVVFYHSLISTSNAEEWDTTHGVESNEHHCFIPFLYSSGFFKDEGKSLMF